MPNRVSVSKSKRATIWNYFIKKDNSTSTCRLCLSQVKTCGNTTNLRNHLKRKHSECYKTNILSDYEEDSTVSKTYINNEYTYNSHRFFLFTDQW